MSSPHDLLAHLATALADRYRVERELGAGGMATVYLAHDLRHDRKVAIKVVHQDLAATLGPERFLAEIRTTAKLQHPHILPLIDSGDAAGVLYYVMPYVAGETLRERLEREQQLPVEDAVRIAREVADALGHAHGHGIVHRDIKPENILLQEGHALVADFGIALAVQSAGGARMTQTGLSLGTPSYMSPEQAMGERTIDARTDLYALGAVTYEMLTGEPPFSGATVQAIVAKVLSAEPERPTLIRKTIPSHVEFAVLRALAKLPADRWARASDFATALVQPSSGAMPLTGTSAIPAPARASRATRALLAATSALAILGGAGSFWLAMRAQPPAAAVRFDVALPDSVALYNAGGHKVALSRDGTRMVFVATRNEVTALYLRRFDDPVAQLVRGTEAIRRTGNIDPAFSHDGEWILFSGTSGLMRVPVAGGRPETVADSGSGAGNWGDDGAILFGRGDSIFLASTTGRSARVVAVPDVTRRIRRLRWPHMLPGGRHALVTIDRSPMRNIADSLYLGVVSLDDGSVTDLDVPGTDARYVSGHIVFGRFDGVVLVAPFSLRSRTLTGPPVRLLEDVWVGGGGAAGFATADNGALAHHGDQSRGANALVVVSEKGLERAVPGDPQRFAGARVSPDGRRIALEVGPDMRTKPSGPILVVDLESGARQRLTADDEGLAPEWSRDGRRVAFIRHVGDVREIVSRAWDRSSPDLVLARDSADDGMFELAIGPPGGWAVVRRFSGGNNRDIHVAPMDSMPAWRPLVATPANERHVSLSADGRWLAYTSDESGIDEVYVQPLPGPGPRVQVSVAGGSEPAWSDRGTTLWYRGAARMMVAELAGAPLAVARRDSLFDDSYNRSVSARTWSPMPGGREFLMVRPSSQLRAVSVILNWPQLASYRAASQAK